MNMEVMYGENPTSLAYSANKLTVAMYPICIEFKAADGTITKGAIKFLSEDRNIPINKFNNLNTGCSWRISPSIKPLDSLQWWVWSPVQVRICCCRYAACNRKLPGEKCIIQLFWINYFKSCSVSIGSVVKCSFTRGMLKSQHSVCNIYDILAVIQNESKQSTKKFDFFIVKKVGWFQKRQASSR